MCSVLLLMLLVSFARPINSIPEVIPIGNLFGVFKLNLVNFTLFIVGAIFAANDTESKYAFEFAIRMHNQRNDSRIKLQPIIHLITKNEPFTFSKQRKNFEHIYHAI